MKLLGGIILGILLVPIVFMAIAATGAYNVSALRSPSKLEKRVANYMVDHSVERRAPATKNPFAASPDVLRAGLAQYKENCVMCHGAPGVEESEAGMGLNPPAPDLTSRGTQKMTDGELFWIVSNGIRMTGMPAFSLTHKPDEIWHLVAFLRHLPQITSDEQRTLKAGTEEGEHRREGDPAASAEGKEAPAAAKAPTPHSHPPDTKPHRD